MVEQKPPPKGETVRLLLVKASLILILIGMLIVGRRNGIWPVINWPMYARLFEAPPPTASDLRLVVVTADGQRKGFLMREIAPHGEHKELAAMIRCTQTEEDPVTRAQCASAVDALARWKVPGRDLAAIEFWEVEWQVDVQALPPLDRSRPDVQRLIGRLEPQNVSEADR